MKNKEIIEQFYNTITEILNWAEDRNFPKSELFNILHANIEEAKDDLIKELEK